MKAQFDQELMSSFYLWFESQLLGSDFAAYDEAIPTQFKYVDFQDLDSDLIGYAGEFRQLVADTGISSPITGFSVNGTGVSADPSANGGLYIDYKDGRIIVPADSGTDLTISGDFSIKQVNTYAAKDSDLEIVLNYDFVEQGASSPFFYAKGEDFDKEVYTLPACFLSHVRSGNTEFCLGGEEETMNRVRALVLAQDSFVLESLMSKFRDSARQYINLIPFEDFPYGFENTLKSYPYNYNTLSNANSGGEAIYIEKVSASKMDSESLRENLNKNFSIAFIDFDLITRRFPRP